MATIRERNGTYQIRVSAGYNVSGKQIVKTLSWKPTDNMTQKQIMKELNRQAMLFEEKVLNGFVADNRQSFAHYAKYALELKERTGVKHLTLKRYISLLEPINEAIGHIKLSELRPQHLNNLYKQLSQDGINKKTGGKLSNKTIIEHHRIISSILTQAEKEMLIPYNPARKATPPKPEKKEVNYFQIQDIKNIIECLDKEPLKWQMLTKLLIMTGCRRGEILGLKWSKVDCINSIIKIDNNLLYSSEKGVFEGTTKTGKARSVRLPVEIMTLLGEYKAEFMELKASNGDRWKGTETLATIRTNKWIKNDYMFVQEDGQPMHPDSITDWLSKFSKRHCLPHINPHAFRHTMASILISQGVDVVTVSKQLGHEKVSTTTDIYSHIIDQVSDKASECMADVVLRKKA